jgi:phosphoglycerate dehydrogenase-like enzyme
MRTGKWRAFMDKPPSLLLNEMTAGILGMGAVGSHLAKILAGCAKKVVGCSRTGKGSSSCPSLTMYAITRLHEFLALSDILVVCVPNTPETDSMIGEKEIDLLPENAIIVNVARGAVIQEQPLYQALKSKRLWGAGLDVWYNYEPEEKDGKRFPFEHPFHELENVVLSPHRGASPLLRPERFDDVLNNIIRYIQHQPLTNRIDLDLGY